MDTSTPTPHDVTDTFTLSEANSALIDAIECLGYVPADNTVVLSLVRNGKHDCTIVAESDVLRAAVDDPDVANIAQVFADDRGTVTCFHITSAGLEMERARNFFSAARRLFALSTDATLFMTDLNELVQPDGSRQLVNLPSDLKSRDDYQSVVNYRESHTYDEEGVRALMKDVDALLVHLTNTPDEVALDSAVTEACKRLASSLTGRDQLLIRITDEAQWDSSNHRSLVRYASALGACVADDSSSLSFASCILQLAGEQPLAASIIRRIPVGSAGYELSRILTHAAVHGPERLLGAIRAAKIPYLGQTSSVGA